MKERLGLIIAGAGAGLVAASLILEGYLAYLRR